MIKIPDEVVEAAALAYRTAPLKRTHLQAMKTAIAAALNAWPGMHVHETRRSWLGGFSERELMLPFPQEARDE
jgi:hypothetical protein